MRETYKNGRMDFDLLNVIFEYLNEAAVILFVYSVSIIMILLLLFYICRAALTPSGVQYVPLEKQRLEIVDTFNPFSFDAQYSAASYSGITCTLASTHACYVQGFWGVRIDSLIELFRQDWKVLRTAIKKHNLADKFRCRCLSSSDVFLLPPNEERTCSFVPQLDDFAATFCQRTGYMRTTYPFVLLMILDSLDNSLNSYLVAVANAVHIRDGNILLPSYLIARYVLTNEGRLGDLKKVYLSSPGTADDGDEGFDLCLICYDRRVSRIFLPCRHTCLCDTCFERCERCPVCRSASSDYIELPPLQKEE